MHVKKQKRTRVYSRNFSYVPTLKDHTLEVEIRSTFPADIGGRFIMMGDFTPFTGPAKIFEWWMSQRPSTEFKKYWIFTQTRGRSFN